MTVQCHCRRWDPTRAGRDLDSLGLAPGQLRVRLLSYNVLAQNLLQGHPYLYRDCPREVRIGFSPVQQLNSPCCPVPRLELPVGRHQEGGGPATAGPRLSPGRACYVVQCVSSIDEFMSRRCSSPRPTTSRRVTCPSSPPGATSTWPRQGPEINR